MPAAGRRNVPAFLGSDGAVIKYLSFWCAADGSGSRPPAAASTPMFIRFQPQTIPFPPRLPSFPPGLTGERGNLAGIWVEMVLTCSPDY